MSLYRIKPMEWEEIAGKLYAADRRIAFVLFKSGDHIFAQYNGIIIGHFDLEESAKDFCDSYRRKLLEAAIEPVFQPTTELPTEPGLYWFKDWISRKWDAVKVEEHSGAMAVNTGRDLYFVAEMSGQWIRIPEPEGDL